MMKDCDFDHKACHLDQPLINGVFEGKITELDLRYNLHGYKQARLTCDVGAIVHFTGFPKPSVAETGKLNNKIRPGYWKASKGTPVLKCPNLYRTYFCDLKNRTVNSYLTEELQQALNDTK